MLRVHLLSLTDSLLHLNTDMTILMIRSNIWQFSWSGQTLFYDDT